MQLHEGEKLELCSLGGRVLKKILGPKRVQVRGE
jgi:hypothetical protein